MTDLDDLRDAMAAPPDFAPRPIDLGSVMAAGGRIRRRRRLVIGAASGLAVAALLVGGVQFAGNSAAPDRGGPAQLAEQPGDDGVLGDVIATGSGDWVLYVKAVDLPELPDTHFGIMAGHRSADGTLTPGVIANETKGSDRAPGFHAVQGSMEIDGKQAPTFGYYVGPATKITATPGGSGKTLTARQATWSEDPSVVVFWFEPSSGAVNHFNAYDSDGRKLPAGDNQAVVG